jgi:SAM-dependent methyltransferase
VTSEVYQQARYYDIAFGFVNVAEQLDALFEPLIRRYSLIPVQSVLDVCCGPSPQLRESARRGYSATGLDLSQAMLGYLRDMADREQVTVETVQADLRDFRLARSVDFAYILMGSIIYVGSNEGLLSHLSAMAAALNSGGLYLLENVFADWTNPQAYEPQSWVMSADGITVHTTYQRQVTDPLRQLARDKLSLDVNDNGVRKQFADEDEVKLLFPEEFRSLVEMHGAFELLGYFQRYRPQPLSSYSGDHTALLRKR